MFGHRVSRPAAGAGLGLRADDLAELAELGRGIAAEYALTSTAVLSATFARLLQRRVPVRGLDRGTAEATFNLRFADGTVIVVRGERVGDVGWAAANALRNRISLASYTCSAEGVSLELSDGHRRVRLGAVALDR